MGVTDRAIKHLQGELNDLDNGDDCAKEYQSYVDQVQTEMDRLEAKLTGAKMDYETVADEEMTWTFKVGALPSDNCELGGVIANAQGADSLRSRLVIIAEKK